MEETKDNEKEEIQESELLRLQREKYEKIIEDKNKIIKDLLNNGTQDGKAKKEKQDEEDEDEEEKAKKLEEERRKKRVAYYKKYIR